MIYSGIDIGPKAQLYLSNDSTTSIQNITAQDWARSEWFPSLFRFLVIAMLSQFLIAYEYILHFPVELGIWYRVIKKKNPSKSFLSWSILWLRYTTLAFGILWIMDMWAKTSSVASCRDTLFPTLYAFAVIVSLSSGYLCICRATTIAKAAFSTRTTYQLVKIISKLCIIARFASLVVAFTLQIQITKAMESQASLTSFNGHQSCFARSLPFFNTPAVQRTAPAKAVIALLSILCGTDSIVAGITFYSIASLKQGVLTQSHLLDELLANSRQFFSILIIVDLFGLIYFCVLKQYNVMALMIASASILTVRILFKEQECILAYSRTLEGPNQTARPSMTREGDRVGAVPRREPEIWRGISVLPPALGGSEKINAQKRGTCHTCRRCMHAQQLRRRGAGLTDIDRVTVLEQGRSWCDEEREARPINSLIAEWTRQTAGAMIGDDDEKEDEEEEKGTSGEDEFASERPRWVHERFRFFESRDNRKTALSGHREEEHKRQCFSLQAEASSPLPRLHKTLSSQVSRTHSIQRQIDNAISSNEDGRTCKTIF